MSYCIRDDYAARTKPTFHDDRDFTDECQREVYELAATLHSALGLTSVLDLGCGSAFKLTKHFEDTIGVDLPPTVEWLKGKYPRRCWRTMEDGCIYASMVVCADMIEHVLDPEEAMRYIRGCRPKLVVMSTPCRASLAEKYGKPEYLLGPPGNGCHVREWTVDEFRAFVGGRMLRHDIINRDQCTQVIVWVP